MFRLAPLSALRAVSRSVPIKLVGCMGLALALATGAQASSEMILAAGFSTVEANGATVGSYGLANITSRDSSGEFCLGYADRDPNHVITLEGDMTELTIAIDSGGADTTLLIQGPDRDVIRCNDNADRRSRDAQIQDTFTKGTYEIWVGAFDQEGRHNYDLVITE